MPHCQVCFKELYSSKLKTIGGQLVCSLSCIGLLNANDKDSCYYCKRPIWKDNYFKINDIFCCSDICKDIIIEDLKIPKDSNLIKHYSESTFIKNSPSFLKKTKQLREEVLKVYNDFKFDSIDESNETQIEKKPELKDELTKKINIINRKVRICRIPIKLKENKSPNIIKNYNKIINNNYLLKIKNIDLKRVNSLKKNVNKITKESSRNNSKLNLGKTNNCKTKYINLKSSHFIPKTTSHINFQTLNNTINLKKEKNTDFNKGSNTPKYEGYYTFYNNNSHKNIYNNYQYNNCTLYTETDNHFYNKKNMNDNNEKELSQAKNNGAYNSNTYRNYSQRTFIKLNRHYNSYKRFKICKKCLKILGNTTFFDTNGNNFCSDKCKSEFLTDNH